MFARSLCGKHSRSGQITHVKRVQRYFDTATTIFATTVSCAASVATAVGATTAVFVAGATAGATAGAGVLGQITYVVRVQRYFDTAITILTITASIAASVATAADAAFVVVATGGAANEIASPGEYAPVWTRNGMPVTQNLTFL